MDMRSDVLRRRRRRRRRGSGSIRGYI